MRAARRWNASWLALVVLMVSFVAIVPESADAAVLSAMQETSQRQDTSIPEHKVLVCHWTPGQGGKYVEIIVDRNSTQLAGHQAHESDIIDPSDGTCPQEDGEYEEVLVSVVVSDCELSDSGHSKTKYEVNIEPAEGATVVVTGAGGYLATFPADGGSDRVPPGTYDWSVTVAEGYTYDGPLSGSFTTVSCDEESVTVTVEPVGCYYNERGAYQGYEVTIDPVGGATVTVTGPNDYLKTFTGALGRDVPPPGEYAWIATIPDGYTPTGPTEGVFTLDPCEDEPVHIDVEVGACVWDGEASLTTYDVTIDEPDDAVLTVSGPDGYVAVYTSSGSDTVTPGTYNWLAVPAPGYVTTDPLSGSFDALDCAPELAALGDTVWHDIDGDGLQNPAEPGIEGVIVHLQQDGSTIDTTSTDAAGLYGFADLLPGDYTVQFEAPAGWIVTSSDQGSDDGLDSDGLTVSTNLSEGEIDLTLDLGVLQMATIVVEKVIDPSTDDVFEFTGDIEAVLGDGGSASAEVLPGVYTVTETIPENWLLADLSCSAGGAGDLGTGTATYTVQSGDLVTCTYTNTNVGTLLIEKVTDVDTDEEFAFEVGAETRTLAAGESVALELPSDVYTITEDLLVVDGWDLVDVICSEGAAIDVDSASATLYVPPGETVGCTFVNGQADEPVGLLGDYVWFDVDADGVQDATEIGVEGATVELFTPGAATPTIATTTNAAGIYVLANVPGGDYQVRFTTPAGWMFTNADQQGDDAVDSDVVHMVSEVSATTEASALPSVGLTDVFTLAPGQVDVTIDAGIFQIQVQDVVVTPTPKTPPASTPPASTPPAVNPDIATPDVADTKVLAAQTELPMTGMSNGGLSVVALVLLGGGAILLATTRRRQEELVVATGFGERLRR